MILSEREKEALRLLLVGHDAKSIAGTLGLSVHTVNDRLRDARRKLGVSPRWMGPPPISSGPSKSGVPTPFLRRKGPISQRHRGLHGTAWRGLPEEC